jgi:hypothetical protein
MNGRRWFRLVMVAMIPMAAISLTLGSAGAQSPAPSASPAAPAASPTPAPSATPAPAARRRASPRDTAAGDICPGGRPGADR